MRVILFAVLLFLGAASTLEAQACREGPLAPIASLFPDQIDGMTRELYTVADGCYTYLYRPADWKEGIPWVVVMLEEHGDPFLGDDERRLAAHYARAGLETHDLDGWPVAYDGTTELGARFVTVKDRLRITVLVKDGTDLESSRELADRVLSRILPGILMPCT